MYFLTIFEGDTPLVERLPFTDFSDAISACGRYYEPRASGAALEFTTVVVRNTLMRAYAELLRAEDLPTTIDANSPRRWKATKDGNAFKFAHSYTFLISTQAGIDELNRREESET
jgi:hypothetical protein